MNQHYASKTTLLLAFLLSQICLFAQPDNDRCDNAAIMILGADSLSCIPVAGDTRGTEDATQVIGPEVCSGSWYMDDVWYKIELGDEVPEFGITIEVRLDPTLDTELIEHGMAFYENCLEDTAPAYCFSENEGRRTLEIAPNCLQANEEYFIRIWSVPLATENSGTFSICAYEGEEDTTNMDTITVLYEEDFSNGLGDWTNVPITESFDINLQMEVPDDWIWTESDCVPSTFGGVECIRDEEDPCREKGAVGFPAGWYQNSRSSDPLSEVFPPYFIFESYLVSPSIDLSAASCVSLKWTESFRGLNGSDISELGPLIEFSIDGGQNWRAPSEANNSSDVSTNYGANYVVNAGVNNVKREIPLLGADGHEAVKIRFGFKGDFYYWIVDDIKIVETLTSDAAILENSISISHIQPMSIHQIDTISFGLDIVNLSCTDQKDLQINLNGQSAAGETVHEELYSYGLLPSDSIDRNVILNNDYVPSQTPDEYTFTYAIQSVEDEIETNNERTLSLETVDEYVFRKENGLATTFLSPNFTIEGWGDNNNLSWEMGNIFFVTNDNSTEGLPYIFDHISFQLSNYEYLENERINVWLYKIEDKNFDFIINKDDSNEISLLGSAIYEVTGHEEGFVTVALSPFPESENLNRLVLEKNTHYLATIEYVHQSEDNFPVMSVSASISDQYQAAYRDKRILSNGNLMKIRYAHAFALGTQNHFRIGPADDPIEGNFDESLVPFIRLGYEPFLGVGLADLQLKEFQIAPSPTSEFVNISFELEEESEVQLSITDFEGRTLMTKQRNWNKNDSERFDISNFSSGVYLLKVQTDRGQLTKKFVVTK